MSKKKNGMRNGLYAVLAALVLTFSLCGCGHKAQTESSSSLNAETSADGHEVQAGELAAEEESSAEADNIPEAESSPDKDGLSKAEEQSERENAEVSDSSRDPQEIPADSTFSVKFIDVGQADAALIECDGHYMMIDGGNRGDSQRIYAELRNGGIRKLDLIIGSGAHEDHIGGLAGALNFATADVTLCPQTEYDTKAFANFKKYADLNGGGITVPQAGEEYPLGSATVKILAVNSTDDDNERSIVTMVRYGGTAFLFMGDAGVETEKILLDSGADLSAAVLKVGHHGSETSTSEAFVKAVQPQYAVIGVGAQNSYGHPTETVLKRLNGAGVQIFRTDLNGDITFVSDGVNVKVSAEKKASPEAVMTPGNKPETTSAETEATSSEVSKEPGNPSDSGNTPPATQAPSQEVTQAPTTQAVPAGRDYVANTNTHKFHYPSCGSVSQMSEHNKWFFHGTRDELISQGYDPCKRCNP